MRKTILLAVIVICSLNILAQPGGKSTYNFLNVNTSARSAALGGSSIAVYDHDLSLVQSNPALLSSGCNNQLNLNFINYFADVNYGYATFAHSFNKYGNYALGMQYISYGDFDRTNERGEQEGTFTASEYAMNLLWSKMLDSSFYLGASLKPIWSHLEQYTSFGVAMDAGLIYNNSKQLLTGAVLIRNAGSQIKPYTEGNFEKLPFDIQVGVTKRLKHAPFRFSVLAHHLHTWDMTYNETNTSSVLALETSSKGNFKKTADKLGRHFAFGVEILLGKNLHLELGYNHQRRKELVVSSKTGSAGFSWGFGLKIKKINVSIGRAVYHLAGASTVFSMGVNFNK